MVSHMPAHKKFSCDIIERFEITKEIISAIRTVRKDKNLPNKELLDLFIRADKTYDKYFLPVIIRMGNLSGISFTEKKLEGAASFISRAIEYYIPLEKMHDVEGELAKISEELDYTRGFLVSVLKKLENKRFVENAPAKVLEMERKKKTDAETKIKSLEERAIELGRVLKLKKIQSKTGGGEREKGRRGD